jgi:hypothetical protein
MYSTLSEENKGIRHYLFLKSKLRKLRNMLLSGFCTNRDYKDVILLLVRNTAGDGAVLVALAGRDSREMQWAGTGSWLVAHTGFLMCEDFAVQMFEPDERLYV